MNAYRPSSVRPINEKFPAGRASEGSSRDRTKEPSVFSTTSEIGRSQLSNEPSGELSRTETTNSPDFVSTLSLGSIRYGIWSGTRSKGSSESRKIRVVRLGGDAYMGAIDRLLRDLVGGNIFICDHGDFFVGID